MLRLRLRSLFRRAAADRELDEELRFHIDKQVEANRAAGMSEAEAFEAAKRQFGDLAQRTEECRDARRMGWIDQIAQDVRYAIRGMRRDPMLALVATLSLAICIGANTTIFSIVNTILLRPLPYPHPERLYWVSEILGRGEEVAISADYFSLRKENQVFDDIAAYDARGVNWNGPEKSEEVDVAMVTPSFFSVFGVQPLLGRTFGPAEMGKKAPFVVILSYPFWRDQLGGDTHIVGKTIKLRGLSGTVIGVMPRGYDYPRGTELWTPISIDESSASLRSGRSAFRIVRMVARLKPEVGATRLNSEMARLTFDIRAEYPKAFRSSAFLDKMRIFATPLQYRITGDIRPALLVLSGAAALVLLIACVNLANLLLARAAARQRELAVRLALGSPRGRLIRQVLTESVALALPGGAFGAVLACFGAKGLNSWQPSVLKNYPSISLDVSTLAFTLGLTVLTGLIFGLAPAFTAAGASIQEALKGAVPTASGGRRTARVKQTLIVAELALSLMLLIAAGLLVRSFVKLASTELGFQPANLLTFTVNLNGNRYRNNAGQLRFFREVKERIQRLPSVRTAAFATDVPLSDRGSWGGQDVQVVGRIPVPAEQRLRTGLSVVSTGFFSTMGIPLRAGRLFQPFDGPDMGPVIVVNEAFARRVFPGEDPIGRSLKTDIPGEQSSIEQIIGVVGDTRGATLGEPPEMKVYLCDRQSTSPFLSRMTVIVRTAGDPHSVIRSIEHEVSAVDRDQPVFSVRTMEEQMEASLAPGRFHLILIGAFAVIAILLAALGVYGVMSYLVTQRTREIGIRMALGARSPDVTGAVMKQSLMLALCGTLVGLFGAWVLTRYLGSMLYGVAPLDAPTFVMMPIVLLAIASVSALVPALRAARIDPLEALREE